MYSIIFTVFTSTVVAATIVANVLSTLVAPYNIGVFTLSGGFIIFPIVYVLSDVISEVYGYSASRKVSLIALWGSILATVSYSAIFLLIGEEKASGIATLATTSGIITSASLIASQVGDWGNDVVFTIMKDKDGNKYFIVRALISSMVGETLDSSIFGLGLMIAFHMTPAAVAMVVVSQVICKLTVELVLMPLTVQLKRLASRHDSHAYKITKSFGLIGKDL